MSDDAHAVASGEIQPGRLGGREGDPDDRVGRRRARHRRVNESGVSIAAGRDVVRRTLPDHLVELDWPALA
ncbi:MAG: hypothetical protein V9F00_17670 [Nocardioides sp.]